MCGPRDAQDQLKGKRAACRGCCPPNSTRGSESRLQQEGFTGKQVFSAHSCTAAQPISSRRSDFLVIHFAGPVSVLVDSFPARLQCSRSSVLHYSALPSTLPKSAACTTRATALKRPDTAVSRISAPITTPNFS
ncbi:hypothetical protein CDD81_2432 [Ophiocordyceps australis]|uniref:Uncharacterized protein n=1 Tax=Ophiocordyceps australis TaxID=1399860 RepID=A0A2C5XWU4_9HYPO|nr:hypothetical protein CDD81_2432 [Ophiocordyceps australis]